MCVSFGDIIIYAFMLVKKGYNKFRGSLVNTNSQYDYKPHAATVYRQKTEAWYDLQCGDPS